ncbi:MAG: hypothetical protein A3H94_07025 [Acidobacteria bacterium RIFCSPLOWO2_02_FULL_60_20]|nr:MAG: hypothetical protein A3H94_07025 [Acidobacteria bacterium RIFCSPLOWO2_02_FULL_60_20]
MTLIETIIALAILFIVAAGLMGLGVVATVTTENQGHLATRTAEYAQDKMEQLLSLKYGDDTSDTISAACVLYLVDDACNTAAGLLPGGDLDFDSPDDDYVDYLDREGNPLGGGAVAPAGWVYMRVWRIDDNATDGTLPANLKRITVACKTSSTVTMQSGDRLSATLTSLKTFPF